MRLFFAVMLPHEIQQRLAALREKLEWIPTEASWVAAGNIHLTLKFLGEVADASVMPLVEAAKSSIMPLGPVTLQPHQLVLFPPEKPARVLAVGFTGDVTRLAALQSQVEDLCAEYGFGREGQPFVPHATLARFRNGLQRRHAPRIEECCSSISTIAPAAVTRFQLMQSVLDSHGPTYTPVATFPL
jgi:RNA 2',3'-cyclic 3'-phosphodiesterase